jgi:hypothetical protein
MSRSALLCAALLGTSAWIASTASATVTVSPADALNGVVLVPGRPSPRPATLETVTVLTPGGAPVVGATVDLILGGAGTYACPGAVLTGVTNAAGQVTLRTFGGGHVSSTPGAAVVRVDGVVVRDYHNAKSPDFDGASGDGVVDLRDLIAFAGSMLGTAPADWHDYDNNGATDVGDLIIFGDAFLRGSHCP